MTDYDKRTGVYSFLISATITLLGNLFYWSMFKPEGVFHFWYDVEEMLLEVKSFRNI